MHILRCSALELTHSLLIQRFRKFSRLLYLDALVHPGKLGIHCIGIPPFITCIHPTQEDIDIDFKEAQTVGSLHKILITIPTIFVCSNETCDLFNALFRSPLLAQIGADNTCRSFTMSCVVGGIVYPLFWVE